MSADFGNERVPEAATVHGLRVATVIAGIGATLPMFLLGAQIAVARGLIQAVLIDFLACVLVGVLAVFTSIVGSRSRLSTYQILSLSFGIRGARFVNVMLGVMLIGWFATTGSMLAAAVRNAVHGLFDVDLPLWMYTVSALGAMTVTGIFGFRVMESFARITVPLLLVLMAYVVWLALQRHGVPALHAGDGSLSAIDSFSSVIGAIILTAVLAPDLTRYAKDDLHAVMSVVGLALGYPLALILAAIPAALLGQADVMTIMASLGIPGLAIVILVMSTWTSNTSNLYSSTLTLATFFRRASTPLLGLGAAVVALGAALLGIADHFIPLLIVLGVVSAPLAGVYVVDFFRVRRLVAGAVFEPPLGVAGTAFAAWGMAAGLGLLETWLHISLTQIPAIDSIVFAGLFYGFVSRKQGGRQRGRRGGVTDPVVEFSTALGPLWIEVFTDQAPHSSAYFLGDVDAGVYDDSSIFRIVKAARNTAHAAPIEVVQLGHRCTDETLAPTIVHENSRRTGLSHRRGTVSLARFAPGAVYHSFFVCLRDEPVLDAGGGRNPDGEGFAAFGRVTRGLELLDELVRGWEHDGEYLDAPLVIERARRREGAC